MTLDIEMEFSNPIFHEGVNITVRAGKKWDIIKNPVPGLLKSIDGKKVVKATFLTSFAARFYDLPQNLLQLEHDPECRDWFKLIAVMESLYPYFGKYDEVTVVFFIPEVTT